jgi:putative ABC transport system substrate-binding protein
LFIQLDPVVLSRREEIVQFLASIRLPALVPNRSWVAVGGLIAYGTSITGLYRRSAFYVDRILRGAKPGDLPIEYPTRFELTLNLTTAEALGLTIPEAVGVQVTEWVR